MIGKLKILAFKKYGIDSGRAASDRTVMLEVSNNPHEVDIADNGSMTCRIGLSVLEECVRDGCDLHLDMDLKSRPRELARLLGEPEATEPEFMENEIDATNFQGSNPDVPMYQVRTWLGTLLTVCDFQSAVVPRHAVISIEQGEHSASVSIGADQVSDVMAWCHAWLVEHRPIAVQEFRFPPDQLVSSNDLNAIVATAKRLNEEAMTINRLVLENFTQQS